MKKFIFIIILLGGCAYYNTFYNAKKYYNEGIKSKKSGSLDIQLFKRSAEKCEKVLNWFPNSQWADDALYLLSLNHFEMGEYDKARIKLREFKNRFPKSPYLPYVYLYLGKINIFFDELNEAEENLLIAKKFNIWEISKEVTKEEMKIYLKRNETDKVIKSGEYALHKFPEKRQDILKILSDAYFFINDTSKALYYLKEIFKESKEESIGLKIARVYMSLDSFNKAIDVSKIYNSPDAKIIRSECLFKLGFNDDAINEIENISQTRRDKYGLLSSIILSEIYESKFDTAKSYVVLKNASSFNVSDSLLFFVKRKVNYLSLFYEKNDSFIVKEDTVISRLFLLGEGYFIYKNDYKRAFEIYKFITEKYNDTIYVPKSMFAIAYIYLDKKKDTLSAISTFEDIKLRFRETAFSNVAEEILGKIKVKTIEK